MTGRRQTPLTRLLFGLLLAAVLASIWFASTPLPLGGPNIWLAGAAVLLAAGCALWRVVRIEERSAVIPTLVADFRPVIPVIAVSGLLVVWALAVYLFTGTLDATRLGQMVLGIGVLFAVYLAVTGAPRARTMALAIILATFVSALFGLAVVVIGDPFRTIWLYLATPALHNLNLILTSGRIAGLTSHTATFSYQVAVGIPLAWAALLYQPDWVAGRMPRRSYRAILFVILMTMVTALVMNASRSAILGVLVGSVVVALPSIRMPSARRRLAIAVPLLALWVLAFFNPVYTVNDLAGVDGGVAAGRPAAQQVDAHSGDGDGNGDGDGLPIHGLAVGAAAGDGNTLRYTIGWLTPGVRYEAQVRARSAEGYGTPSTTASWGADDGSLTLTWRPPDEPAGVIGYQFRLRGVPETQWRMWQDFVPESDTGDRTDIIRAVGYWPDDIVGVSDRIFMIANPSSQIRLLLIVTALRYSLDYPLGTGVYAPTDAHVSARLYPETKAEVLGEWPHNQFLHALVLFGFPGLILLILFYALVVRSLIRSVRFIKGASDGMLVFLGTAVAGALAAYTTVTMFVPVGPFILGWSHFFIIGLAFSIERIAAERKAAGEPAAPSD